MPPFQMRNTVDRLDRPSSYAMSKVHPHPSLSRTPQLTPHPSQYKKRKRNDTHTDATRPASPDLESKLSAASTLYIGNLSFYTTEEQIHALFSKAGELKRLVMGLDRFSKTPCGFCFVEYYSHADALDCLKYIGGTKLDERIIRCDLDEGFVEGRQYGRGKSGGQVRDEYREEFDPGRGGFGRRGEGDGVGDEYLQGA